MLNMLLRGLLYMVLHIKELLTSILRKDFITTQAIIGSCLALLSLVMEDYRVVYLSVVFLITFLIQGVGYLIIMMKTFGWQVQVEVWVDIGVLLGVMAYLLLTALSLLAAYHSCML